MYRVVEDDMPPFPENISDLLRDFLTQCFQKDLSQRPDASTLLKHKWLGRDDLSRKVCSMSVIAYFR